MRVSGALGIKGCKQFQLSLIIFYTAERREFKQNATNIQLKATICAYKMYTQIESTVHYCGTLLKHFMVIYNEMRSPLFGMCSQMASGVQIHLQLVAHRKSVRLSRGVQLFQESRSLVLFKFSVVLSAVSVF